MQTADSRGRQSKVRSSVAVIQQTRWGSQQGIGGTVEQSVESGSL